MDIFKTLRDAGHRITPQRTEVLEQLYGRPQTVEELFRALKKNNVEIDLVSVYRTLQLFLEYGIVAQVDFGDGKKRYELVRHNKHHHHLICNDCGNVEDITLPQEEKIINVISKQSNFQIKTHTVEFFGLCTHCQ